MRKRFADTRGSVSRADRGGSLRAFTLVEILVTMSILAILISLLLPGLRSVGVRSRKLVCVMNLRSIAFDFSVFANADIASDRGDDSGSERFWLDTFQEMQYGVDEFWRSSESRQEMDASDLDVMNCPEVKGTVTKRRNTPCRSGAVGPTSNISYGFNLRLDSPEIKIGGMWTARPRTLNSRVLQAYGMVPLALDINGAEAQRRDKVPYYTAPPIGDDASRPYADGGVWFPGQRHDGAVPVAFVGGEVQTVSDASPQANSSWRWDYQNEN